MVPQLQNKAVRYSLFALWLLIVGGALYLYFFEREFVQGELQSAFSTSMVVGSIVYILLGSFRAFTLVPATFLLLVGLPFFPPLWLLLITMTAVVVSSSICYFFAEALHLDEVFERKYPQADPETEGPAAALPAADHHRLELHDVPADGPDLLRLRHLADQLHEVHLRRDDR